MAEARTTPAATPSLRLSREQRERLGKFLQERTAELEELHRPLVHNISTWWEWYEAKPAVERRNDPWPGASNVIIPLIQTHADAFKSRFQNLVYATAPDLVRSKTSNEAMRDVGQHAATFWNRAADDNVFDFRTPFTHASDEMTILGSGIFHLRWAQRTRHVLSPRTGRPVQVSLGSGPLVEHVEREKILWQLGKPIHDSEIVVRQAMKTATDLVLMHQGDGIDLDDEEFEELLGKASDAGYSRAVADAKRSIDGLSWISSDADYDIREAWVDWPSLRREVFKSPKDEPDAALLPLVVTYERKSGMVLRVINKPFLTRGMPFYEAQFRSASSRRAPGGISKRLNHLQRAVSTIYNQAIDSVTLANALTGITSDPDLSGQQFTPGRWLRINDITQFKELALNKGITPDVTLIQLAMAVAERVTGIGNPTFGQETRLGGHPSPASSTAMLLQESNQTVKTTANSFRQQINRLVEDTFSLYKQFDPAPDQVTSLIGREDGQVLLEWLSTSNPVVADLSFDMKFSTENINQQTAIEQAVFTQQALASYNSQVLQIVSAVERQQLGPTGTQFAMKFIEGLTESTIRILEAADVDDIRRFVLEVKNSNGSPESLSQFNEFAQDRLIELASSNGEQQLPPTAETPVAAPVGPNGATGPGGF